MEIFAYLDAGTGSLIIQAVIGGVVGLGVILKVYWGKIVGVFKKTDSDNKNIKKTEATTKSKTGKT
ncbi:MAG TPA: hypothetical protein VI336_03310 [Candidatus Saccharimonadales bacterium]|nr:hypothetical protein [Candidatus Saccharimonadales bacterium]